MKRIIISIILAAVLTLGITACTYANMCGEMAEAVTAMSKHKNVETELRIWANNGNGKDDVITYEGLLDAVKNIGTNNTDDIVEYAESFAFDAVIGYRYDENSNFSIDISLPSNEGTTYKRLVNMMFIDNKLYIGTDFLQKLIESVDLSDYGINADTLSVLYSDTEYILIDAGVSELIGYDIDETKIDSVKKTVSESFYSLTDIIKETFPKIITSDLKVLSHKDGIYNLKIDEKQALQILNALINVIKENKDTFSEVLNKIVPANSINGGDVDTLLNSLNEVATSEEWDMITGSFDYKITADDISQEMRLDASLSHSGYNQTVNFGFSSRSNALDSCLEVPEGNTTTIGDVVNALIANMYVGALSGIGD